MKVRTLLLFSEVKADIYPGILEGTSSGAGHYATHSFPEVCQASMWFDS